MQFASDVPIEQAERCDSCGNEPRITARLSVDVDDFRTTIDLCRDCVHLAYLALLAATNDDQCPGIFCEDATGQSDGSTDHCAGCLHGD